VGRQLTDWQLTDRTTYRTTTHRQGQGKRVLTDYDNLPTGLDKTTTYRLWQLTDGKSAVGKLISHLLAAKSWWKLTFISPIVGDPQGILDQQLRPNPIHLPNLITIILISYTIIKLLLIKKQKWGPSWPKPETELSASSNTQTENAKQKQTQMWQRHFGYYQKLKNFTPLCTYTLALCSPWVNTEISLLWDTLKYDRTSLLWRGGNGKH